MGSVRDAEYAFYASEVGDLGSIQDVKAAFFKKYPRGFGSSLRPKGNSVVFLGDSITVVDSLQGGSAIDGSTSTIQRGESFSVLSTYTKGSKMNFRYNAGVSGNRSDQMLARIDTDVIAKKPAVCIVLAGTNDVGQGIAFSVYQTNMKAIIAKLANAGIIPVICLITPKSTGGGTPIIAKWNAWLSAYCGSNGIHVIDTYSPLADPTTGGLKASYDSGDSTHPNAAGHAVLATVVKNAMANILPEYSPYLVSSSSDTSNLLLGGTFSADGNADGIADGWANYSTPTGGTYSRSLSTDPEVVGQLQRLTSTGTTGALNAIYQQVALGPNLAIGDKVRFNCVLSTSGGIGAEIWINHTNINVVKAHRIAGMQVTKLIVSCDSVVPPGTGRLDICFVVQPGTGWMEIGQATLVNLSQMGL